MNFQTYKRAALAPLAVGVTGMFLIKSLNLDDLFVVIIIFTVPIVTFLWLFRILAKELLSDNTQKLSPDSNTKPGKQKKLRIALWIILGIIILVFIMIIFRVFGISFSLPS